MATPVIEVEGLGKEFEVSLVGNQDANLSRPIARRWLGRLRNLLRQDTREPGDRRASTLWALRDVSFHVDRGEVLGVIGRNGSGKSTLLKILSGITEPTVGRADIDGRVGSLLEVGTGFHPDLSGRENVYLNGAILGIPKAEIARRFDEIVAFAEVERFIDTPVKFYSSGMHVRLAFAVAAHLDPEILLLDEVLAVGDVAFQRKCLGKMGMVVKEGRTVIFVSHNLAAVRTLCNRTLLLNSGKLEKIGETEEVIGHYLSRNSAELTTTVVLPPSSPHDPGSGRRLTFSTEIGSPQAQFRVGEPWRINLEFSLSRSVPHVIAAVGLMSLEAVPLITYWSTPKDLTPGRYCAEFECDLPFAACEIQFAVGLSSYERPFYYVEGIGHVSISSVAIREQPVRTSGSGILVNLRSSEIHPVAAAERLAL
ncbi:MAG: ABC transporter ATP-binding protein [Nitrospira sp.]